MHGGRTKSFTRLVVLLTVEWCFFITPLEVAAYDAAYDRTIMEGVEEFSRGNYTEARALFREAHKINPNARTLRGIGMSAYEMRDYVDALNTLEKALIDKRRPLTNDQRREVKKLVARCRSFIGTYEVVVVPQNARLSVDGTVVELVEANKLLLDPGEHEIVAVADGYRTLSRKLVTKGGESSALELELESISPVKTTETEQSSAEQKTTIDPGLRDDGDTSSSGYLWTWVAASSAVAFAGAAVAFWMLADDAYSDVEEACKEVECRTGKEVEAFAAKTDLSTYETLTNISLILSGTSLVGAAILFFVESGSEEETTRVGIDIGMAAIRIHGNY